MAGPKPKKAKKPGGFGKKARLALLQKKNAAQIARLIVSRDPQKRKLGKWLRKNKYYIVDINKSFFKSPLEKSTILYGERHLDDDIAKDQAGLIEKFKVRTVMQEGRHSDSHESYVDKGNRSPYSLKELFESGKLNKKTLDAIEKQFDSAFDPHSMLYENFETNYNILLSTLLTMKEKHKLSRSTKKEIKEIRNELKKVAKKVKVVFEGDPLIEMPKLYEEMDALSDVESLAGFSMSHEIIEENTIKSLYEGAGLEAPKENIRDSFKTAIREDKQFRRKIIKSSLDKDIIQNILKNELVERGISADNPLEKYKDLVKKDEEVYSKLMQPLFEKYIFKRKGVNENIMLNTVGIHEIPTNFQEFYNMPIYLWHPKTIRSLEKSGILLHPTLEKYLYIRMSNHSFTKRDAYIGESKIPFQRVDHAVQKVGGVFVGIESAQSHAEMLDVLKERERASSKLAYPEKLSEIEKEKLTAETEQLSERGEKLRYEREKSMLQNMMNEADKFKSLGGPSIAILGAKHVMPASEINKGLKEASRPFIAIAKKGDIDELNSFLYAIGLTMD